jgi:glucokinase
LMGFDIGSYGLRAALIDLQNHTYAALQSDIGEPHAETMVADTIALGRRLLETRGVDPRKLVRIGAGVGSPVDARQGIVLMSPRLAGWEQFPLADRLEESFGAATLVDNDANLIALAEATFGAAEGLEHLIYIHLSAGVGGGLVLNGRLYHGSRTMAGEIGHAVVGLTDPVWAGPPATLEQHLSTSGLLKRAGELGLNTANLEEVFGHPTVGTQITDEVANILAVRLSQMIALVDPQAVVLGGVVTRLGGAALLTAISARLAQYTTAPLAHTVPVIAAELGFDSVAIGGLALALNSLRD